MARSGIVERTPWFGRGLRLAPVVALLAHAPAAAQTATVVGRVEDREIGFAIPDVAIALVGTSRTTTTDDLGDFQLSGIAPGDYDLRVTHIAYGEQSIRLEVREAGTVSLRILLSDSAISLEPIDVEVLSEEARRARATGYRRGVVLREQIARFEGTNMTMGDVLRRYVPGVRVRTAGNLVGSPLCIELRTIKTTTRNDCLEPAVFLDGVPVSNPTQLFHSLGLRMIESMEVVPAAEAGARYGSGALHGALLIETRKPGVDVAENERAARSNSRTFDWSQQIRPHPSKRSFLLALVGNAAGLAAGVATANQCIGTRQPANDRIIARCDAGPTLASASAALLLPALGSAVGARIGGSTDVSRGKLVPAVIGASMALLPGYGLLFSAKRTDSSVIQALGISLLVVGTPLASTVADHQFRSFR